MPWNWRGGAILPQLGGASADWAGGDGQQALRELPLAPWASRRREDLFGLLATLDQQIAPLDRAVAEAAQQNAQARLLMNQSGQW